LGSSVGVNEAKVRTRKERLDREEQNIDEKWDKCRVKLWIIEFMRKRNSLVPIESNLDKLTDRGREARLVALDSLIVSIKQTLGEWRKDEYLSITLGGAKCVRAMNKLLERCREDRESLVLGQGSQGTLTDFLGTDMLSESDDAGRNAADTLLNEAEREDIRRQLDADSKAQMDLDNEFLFELWGEGKQFSPSDSMEQPGLDGETDKDPGNRETPKEKLKEKK